MAKYIVRITKFGEAEVEANSPEEAEEFARELESDGSFELDIEVEVEEE